MGSSAVGGGSPRPWLAWRRQPPQLLVELAHQQARQPRDTHRVRAMGGWAEVLGVLRHEGVAAAVHGRREDMPIILVCLHVGFQSSYPLTMASGKKPFIAWSLWSNSSSGIRFGRFRLASSRTSCDQCGSMMSCSLIFFFFNDTATTEIYTLSLHDALPIFLHQEHVQEPPPEQMRGTPRL